MDCVLQNQGMRYITMKKTSIILLGLTSSLLSGCAGFSQAMVNAMDSMGIEDPTGASQIAKQQAAEESRRLKTPVIQVAKDFPEGEYSEKFDNGNIKFKTYVQNSCFDKYIDIYFPNGQLRTHTPLVNCKANGVSQGYLENGDLRTEIPYVDGYAQGDVKVYDKEGKVAETKTFDRGYPVDSNKKTVN